MLRKISQKQREEGSVETGSCHRKGVHEGRIRTHVEGVQPPQCPVAAGELCGPQNSLPAVRTPLSPIPTHWTVLLSSRTLTHLSGLF